MIRIKNGSKKAEGGTGTDKLDQIEKEIRELPSNKLDELLKRLGALKLGTLAAAEVKIDDWQTKRDRMWPRATVMLGNKTVESIDIIRSIRNDATAIGHPAILLAIRRWEHLVIYHCALSRSNHYRPLRDDFHKIAKDHLRRVGEALLYGARSRALPAESAYYLLKELGTGLDYDYLYIAWRLLNSDQVKWKSYGEGIKKPRKPVEKLRVLEQLLREKVKDLPLLQLRLSIVQERNLMSMLKFSLPDIAVEMVDPKILPQSYSVYDPEVTTDYSIIIATDDAEIARISLEDIVKHSGRFSISSRKMMAAALGLIQCADDLPGAERLKYTKIGIIVDFLKSNEGIRHLQSRVRWATFVSAFDSWRFSIPSATLRTYRYRARKKSIIDFNKVDNVFLVPDWINEYRFAQMYKWPSLPIVPAEEI